MFEFPFRLNRLTVVKAADLLKTVFREIACLCVITCFFQELLFTLSAVLGKLAKLQKANISSLVCLSVGPSVRLHLTTRFPLHKFSLIYHLYIYIYKMIFQHRVISIARTNTMCGSYYMLIHTRMLQIAAFRVLPRFCNSRQLGFLHLELPTF